MLCALTLSSSTMFKSSLLCFFVVLFSLQLFHVTRAYHIFFMSSVYNIAPIEFLKLAIHSWLSVLWSLGSTIFIPVSILILYWIYHYILPLGFFYFAIRNNKIVMHIHSIHIDMLYAKANISRKIFDIISHGSIRAAEWVKNARARNGRSQTIQKSNIRIRSIFIDVCVLVCVMYNANQYGNAYLSCVYLL